MDLAERFFELDPRLSVEFIDWGGCTASPMPMKGKPIADSGRQWLCATNVDDRKCGVWHPKNCDRERRFLRRRGGRAFS
jgi:hypothetical protein